MNNTADNRNALPIGYRLNDYQIQKVLGDGTFGMTYLAQDRQLNALVAIKEYLPNEMAVRENNYTVQAKSQKDAANFAWGLDRFIKEARILAQLKHPNIVRVLRFFEAHHTAYIVMDYEQGQSLASFIKDGETATEAEIMTILLPLLNGLEVVHRAGYLHRDIKPSNIYLRTDDYTPVLIDFGAARYEVGSRSRTLTAIVTPGYAPFEQYETKGSQQGAWSDIYALGAVLYRLIHGKTPVESPERMGAIVRLQPDPLTPAVEIGRGQYSQQLLEAIDWALNTKENERPQSVEAWREKLNPPQPVTKEGSASLESLTSPITPPVAPRHSSRLAIGVSVVILVALFLGGGWWFYRQHEARLQAEATAAVAAEQALYERQVAETMIAQAQRERELADASVAQARGERNAAVAAAKKARRERNAAVAKAAQARGARDAAVAEAAQARRELEAAKQALHERETSAEREARLRDEAQKRAAAVQAQLPKGSLRMITGAGVRLRQESRRNARINARLHIGTIVLELAETHQGGETWYQVEPVEPPLHNNGWVHGNYALLFAADERAQAYIQVAQNKLNHRQASFGDLVELYHFLTRASDTVELDSAVELKLLQLLALQRTLDNIPLDNQAQPPYSGWLTGHQAKIVYDTSRGRWLVKRELFQQLHDNYRFMPIAERILREVP